MRILVTGGAGFIGSHLCERLVEDGHDVVAIDNFDPFYDPDVKRRNLAGLVGNPRFHLIEADVCDSGRVEAELDVLPVTSFDVLIHLAAKAGIRPSIRDPLAYTRTNVSGTLAMLELAGNRGIQRFVFGSSSSVYGNSAPVPFSEADCVARPISPYAATKRAGELLCHTYHHLRELSVVCLRLFTVYGPRQRPDLAIHKFTRLMLQGESIPVFGDGSSERDYTYVDDVVQGILGAVRLTAGPEPVYEIINLGRSEPTSLKELVGLIAAALGVEPRVAAQPAQPGDVERTFADIARARSLLDYHPATPVQEGISRFVSWFRQEHAPTQDHLPCDPDEGGKARES